MLVSQHMAYAIKHPEEIEQYDSIYDHMLYFFTAIIGMAEDLAIKHIDDFFSDTFSLVNAHSPQI
jgi:hypothetical protein